MKKLHTIALDVDEVLGYLHEPWIEWGRKKFSRTPDRTTFPDWDAPERWWGKEAYEFLTPNIYDDNTVQPVDGALQAVNRLRMMNAKIMFATSNPNVATSNAKELWLRRHGFSKEGDQYVSTHNKGTINADVLVDDGVHNLLSFRNCGILKTAPHNAYEAWHGSRIEHIKDLPALIYHLDRT